MLITHLKEVKSVFKHKESIDFISVRKIIYILYIYFRNELRKRYNGWKCNNERRVEAEAS